MLEVKDFIETYYPDKSVLENDATLEDFENWKEENNITEWDYPLEEYCHIAKIHEEDGTEYEPVCFLNSYGGCDYRFCEVPYND